MNIPVYLYAWISLDTSRTPQVLGWGSGSWQAVERPTTKAANLACDAAQALMAGVAPTLRDGSGLFIGTTTGSLHDDIIFDNSRTTDGGQYPSPNAFRRTLPSTIATELTMDLGLHGPVVVYAAGAASAVVACVRGAEYIRRGMVPLAIVGGIEVWHEAITGGIAPAHVSADAAITAQPQVSPERCQMVLACIGPAELPGAPRPMSEFTQARLGGSNIHSPTTVNCRLQPLVDFLVAGQGQLVVDGAVGIKAWLELQRR